MLQHSRWSSQRDPGANVGFPPRSPLREADQGLCTARYSFHLSHFCIFQENLSFNLVFFFVFQYYAGVTYDVAAYDRLWLASHLALLWQRALALMPAVDR